MTAATRISARLSGNDYSMLEARLADTSASKPVSIVVPTYNRAEKLARSLAAMTHLDAPKGGFEVVVADDGSTDGTGEVVRDFEARLDIVHVRQADRGHRLAEVCNLGIRTARHERIVLLQSDMAPAPGLLTAYGRWLDLEAALLLVGMRRFTCTEQLEVNAILEDPSFSVRLPAIRTGNAMWRDDPDGPTEDWRLPLYRRTDWLKSEPAPFRAVVGSNLAFRRADALRIGGFCEDFRSWGGEDGEFGYRAFLAGLAIVPVRDAVAFHQEPPGGVNETDREVGFATSRRLREALCALPPYRPPGLRGPDLTPRLAVGSLGSLVPLHPKAEDDLHARVCCSDVPRDGAAARLHALAASGAPYLLLCAPSWPEAARLPPDVLDSLVSGEGDVALIETPGKGLLLTTRAWNRITALEGASLDAADFEGLAALLISRYAGHPSGTSCAELPHLG